ncbi:1-deoxy-D-xylulose-5-phosphate synthase [Muribaculaceae bacterium Isolate-104 (HZI)]|jgi:1-deoxy-D-xylulose-5-phosphate synthase|nr:1-deoxy-D-xylulose-5-phosphate synthase [Muribaculaceae bacterium Isolate-104 (HZI)]
MCAVKTTTTTLKVPADESIHKPDPEVYPLLSSINSPDDLRRLPQDSLPAVCADIRHFLIDSLSTNPGHFASSMGAVELTVALHYVFNTPYDRIVWDVGHQAYGHKLLTGRAGRFHTNRKLGGISGFPNPDESEYDTFTAGHASNSISAALGMAAAGALKKETPRRNVVAVIGDASISGGLAFEGLNNAANANSNLLIVLNDNDMSIDRNVGSLNSYLAHLAASKGYNSFRNKLSRVARRLGLVTDSGKWRILRFNNSIKSLISKEQNIFEGLNIRYFGPFDGHDLPRIVKVLNDIKDIPGPRLLHLRTIKGKGYAPAENDPAPWHAPGCFDPGSGKRLGEGDDRHRPKFQTVFGETLKTLAASNSRIVGITAAMSSGTSMNILQESMPARVFDVGISEGHAVTFAGGLAKEGMLPYVAIYSAFLQRAYDNIIHDVAVQGLPVTFCIDRAGLVGEDGVTHHGVLDLTYMRAIPGITVAAPRNADILRNLLYTSQLPDRQGPWAIRYPRGRGYCADPDAPMQKVEIGKGELLRAGSDVTVLSLGAIASEVSEAIDKAESRRVSAAHYDMAFLKPLDEDILAEVVRAGKPVVTVEDGTVEGGLGGAVLEWMSANGHSLLVTRIGVPDSFVPQGKVPQLFKLCGMDADAIAETIVRAGRGTAQS